jgi:hypothetical protein
LVVFALFPLGAHSLTIESRVGAGEWSKAASISPLKGEAVRLRVASRPGSSIRWFHISPDIGKLYHNAEWPWNPGAYKWLGYERISYRLCEVEGSRGRWEIDPLAGSVCSPSTPTDHFRVDLGTFWFQAVVTGPSGEDHSPGLKEADDRGLSPGTFRVSIREDGTLLGTLTSFFNVPAVFGSTPHQSLQYLGVDCADVLMASWSLRQRIPMEKNENVGSVMARFPKKARFHLSSGRPDRKVAWGKDIRPGDFLAVKYVGARMYQHIGALYRDSNRDGLLDPGDLVLHAGPEPLHLSSLSQGAFDGEITVVRAD